MSETCPVCGSPREHRSRNSHGHYFVTLNEKYQTMPERVTERLPTFESFRKYALIRTGWRDERSIVCASKAEARRVAAFIRPMDEFAIVTVTEATIVVWTAKSQSMKAMGKGPFQKSKDDVLAYADNLLGVSAQPTGRKAA